MPPVNVYVGERDIWDAGNDVQTEDGGWVQGRRLGFSSIAHTLRCLWLVATGKADIVVWKRPENNVKPF